MFLHRRWVVEEVFVTEKIKALFDEDKDSLKEVSRVLLDEAKLIEGLPVDDIARFVELATKYISK